MGKKNLVSINDFSRDEILKIMDLAARFEADPHQQVLAGKVIASLFFDPHTIELRERNQPFGWPCNWLLRYCQHQRFER